MKGERQRMRIRAPIMAWEAISATSSWLVVRFWIINHAGETLLGSSGHARKDYFVHGRFPYADSLTSDHWPNLHHARAIPNRLCFVMFCQWTLSRGSQSRNETDSWRIRRGLSSHFSTVQQLWCDNAAAMQQETYYSSAYLGLPGRGVCAERVFPIFHPTRSSAKIGFNKLFISITACIIR
jgi:hypothetical protein